MKKYYLLFLFNILFSFSLLANDWNATVSEAKGKKVFFYAWGGSQSINQYIDWAANEAKKLYQIEVTHVKISDTVQVVQKLLAEQKANSDEKSSIDMMWINGENFYNLKKANLLQKFAEEIPNYQLLDIEGKKLDIDFTIPTDGFEAPWGSAQLIFIYDKKQVKSPPKNVQELKKFIIKNPGQFTYPQPPNFHGTTFLKQLLYGLIDNTEELLEPVNMAKFEKQTQALWEYLDAIHPHLWNAGKAFPESIEVLKRQFADGGLKLIFSFNPNEPDNLVFQNIYKPTTRSYVFENGTIGNTHYLALPKKSSSAAAKVFINFMLSPKAQARKSDPQIWGDPTVINMAVLNKEQKQYFDNIKKGEASPKTLGTVLSEPHASWVEAIENHWRKKYGI